MHIVIRLLTFLLLTFYLFTVRGYSQTEHVYLVKMFECANKPEQRSQTGFRVKGMKGIVTALHGVVGCRRITVKSEKGLILFSPVKIDKVDIEHDAALLTSEELERKDVEGIEVAQSVKWNSLGAVRIDGHPFGINNLGTSLVVRTPPLRILKELIPPHISSLMRNRNSPNPLINVLSIQGDILPGHSGAPILDSQNRVIAIGNGGLESGKVGISWAVPFRDIEWEPAESNKRLVALAQTDIRVLFSIDANTRQETSAASTANDAFCEIVGRYLDASRDGFMSIVSKPNAIGNLFDSTIQLPSLYNSAVSPRKYAYSATKNSDNSSQVESEYFHLIRKMSSCLAGWSTREYVDKVDGKEDMIFIFWQSIDGPTVSIEKDITGFVYKNNPPIYNVKVYFYAPGYKNPNPRN